MELENTIFQKKIPDTKKLLAYGFQEEEKNYLYETTLKHGSFQVKVRIYKKTNEVLAQVLDPLTGEEYLPIRLEAARGEFIYEVKEEFCALLQDIADCCFTSLPFLLPQTNRIALLLKEKYQTPWDYPFSDDKDDACFRVPKSKKWFALILRVPEKKIRPEGKEKDIEVLNLKAKESEMPTLIQKKGIRTAYHMSHKNWISVILDDEVADEEILALAEKSRELVLGKSKNSPTGKKNWLVPANLDTYDIYDEWQNTDDVYWWQSKNMEVGDAVYVYVSFPFHAILYRAVITETNLDSGEGRKEVQMYITDRYDPNFCTFRRVMKKYGVTAVRGPRYLPDALVEYLAKKEKD